MPKSKHTIELNSPGNSQGEDLKLVQDAFKSYSNVSIALNNSGRLVATYEGDLDGEEVITDGLNAAGIRAYVEDYQNDEEAADLITSAVTGSRFTGGVTINFGTSESAETIHMTLATHLPPETYQALRTLMRDEADPE